MYHVFLVDKVNRWKLGAFTVAEKMIFDQWLETKFIISEEFLDKSETCTFTPTVFLGWTSAKLTMFYETWDDARTQAGKSLSERPRFLRRPWSSMTTINMMVVPSAKVEEKRFKNVHMRAWDELTLVRGRDPTNVYYPDPVGMLKSFGVQVRNQS